MRRPVWTLALVALAVLSSVRGADAADSICDVKKCKANGGSKDCDRTKEKCPPCLYERERLFGVLSSTFECYKEDSDGVCPDKSTLCSASIVTPTPTPTSTSSGSSSTDPTPEPTTKAPKPTTKAPVTSTSSSGSGSSGSTPVATSKAPKTSKPTATPTPTPSLKRTNSPSSSPTPPPPQTQEPQSADITQSPSSNSSSKDSKSSGSNLPMIIGISGGAVVVIAAVVFFIWKSRRDDDDDSDDEDYRYKPPPPKSGMNNTAGRAAPTPYGNGLQAQTSPGRPVSSYAAGAATQQQYGGSNYNVATTSYAVGGATAAGIDYDSPTAVGGGKAMYTNEFNTNRAGVIIGAGAGAGTTTVAVTQERESLSSNEGGRDVWGNTVSSSYRDNKRTLSNVSVEF
ncbi:hypothetical protein PINS_up005479 [Pythium insidiosum]|nr:hypothetical protein PINS_up005479 [Pythium insidiosum]